MALFCWPNITGTALGINSKWSLADSYQISCEFKVKNTINSNAYQNNRYIYVVKKYQNNSNQCYSGERYRAIMALLLFF